MPKRAEPIPADGENRTFRHEAFGEFIEKAKIHPLGANKLPIPDKSVNYYDDLRLGSFRPIRYTWAGERRQGIAMHIADDTSIGDHLRRSIMEDCYLSKGAASRASRRNPSGSSKTPIREPSGYGGAYRPGGSGTWRVASLKRKKSGAPELRSVLHPQQVNS